MDDGTRRAGVRRYNRLMKLQSDGETTDATSAPSAEVIAQYLRTHSEFEIDKRIDHKLLISVAPDGYLKRVR